LVRQPQLEKLNVHIDWKHVVAEWRTLTAEEQRQVRLRRIPSKVAKSMAFENEPVDIRMLEEELERLMNQRAKQR
jgi:macrodomain Ter protein organizer (MatP/YcbG family)